MKTYGAAPYAAALRKLEQQIKERQSSVNDKIGVKVQIHGKVFGMGAYTTIGIRYWFSTTSSMGRCRR